MRQYHIAPLPVNAFKNLFRNCPPVLASAPMTLRIIGDPPLARDAQGALKSRIATLFPRSRTLVTLPGIHATQRMAYVHALNADLIARGLPPLSEEEEMSEWQQSVDLIVDEDSILIRPDPDNMTLAFEADEQLQELVSKPRIKFLHVLNAKVRQAIKERGENWRIAALPHTPEDMKTMIRSSRIRIGGRAIYYYNRMVGTRVLTADSFASLGDLPDIELAAHLGEIRDFSLRHNRRGYPEISFFATDESFGPSSFAAADTQQLTTDGLRAHFEDLKTRFRNAVPPDLRDDDPDNTVWRNRMFGTLIAQRDEAIPEETLLGLSSEFFMQIEWLPGGRIEDGELIFDPVYDEFERTPESADLRQLCDEKARGFIFNFVREFGDVAYVNVGRIIGSLSQRPTMAGRRAVYVAEIKQSGTPTPFVRVIRMQKWGIREHLEEGKDLLQAIMESEDYTDYILDRRLGCRQLGMNLPARITTRKITERYHGSRREYDGQMVWSTYFERDYVSGIATDKIPRSRYQNPRFALRLAALLGRTAAVNSIVGRMNLDNRILFDDGDEIVIEGAEGLPTDIVVADHTGAFVDYTSPLEAQAASYALPVERRAPFIPHAAEFADAYAESFLERFLHIQAEYRKRKRAFDTLFKHRRRDEHGSFAFRWERVLDRLNCTDGARLAAEIRAHIRPA